MINKLETEEFIKKAREIHGDKYDYSKTNLNKKDDKRRVSIICPIHGEFKQNFHSHLKGCGCSKCGKVKMALTQSFTKEMFIERAKNIHGNKYDYSKVEYKNYETKVCIICPEHGEFWQTPNCHLNGQGCPKCSVSKSIDNLTSNTDDFIEKAKKIHGDKYDYKLVDYKGAKVPVEIVCQKGHIFKQMPNKHLQGHGCPYHHLTYSVNENKIYEYVKTLFPNVIQHDRTVLNGNELDIYIPDKKIAIEYNGLYWHSELQKRNNYHLLKTEECEKQGIKLIHIFEDEWLHKTKICKSILNNIFGLTESKIDAEKCIIKEVNTKETTDFLNDNYINGWCPSQIKLGLYYENQLVSLMTFGKSKHSISNKQTEYELLRFCDKINIAVINGASKLFNYFVKNYRPTSVICYIDRRWFNGDLYQKLGFKFIRNSKPNYYYIIGTIRKNRFNFRKSVLIKKYNCPTDMTEKEFCHKQKWYRIYDCGTKLYKWKINKN